MTARQRLRRRLLLAGLVPALLSTAVVGKVGWVHHHTDSGTAAIEAGAPDRARDDFAANAALNVLETWIAPYDEGVAAFLQQDHDDAARLFETALEAAPPEQRCRVRTNLGLSLEAQGDAPDGDETAEARLVWLDARRALAPCVPAVASVERIDLRLTRKLARAAADLEERQRRDPEAPPPYEDEVDTADLTLAERGELLERLNDEARRTRVRDREPRPPKSPADEPLVYNW